MDVREATEGRAFRLSEEHFRRLGRTLLVLVVPLMVVAVVAPAFLDARDRPGPVRFPWAVLSVMMAIVTVSLATAWRRQRRLLRTYRLTIGRDLVSRTQEGLADLRLPASEIRRVAETTGRGLSIYRDRGGPALNIPETLEGYDECRALLGQWAVIETRAPLLDRRLVPVAALALLAAYFEFNRTRDPRLVVLLGVPLAALFLVGHWRVMHGADYDRRTRRLAWFGLLVVAQIVVRIYRALGPGH